MHCPYRPTRTALLATASLICFVHCSHMSRGSNAASAPSSGKAAGAATPVEAAHTPEGTDAPASALAQGKIMTLGPTGLMLPVFLRPMGTEASRFGVAAARALRMVYEEDSDDAAALEALLHRLDNTQMPSKDGQDHRVWQQVWRPVLHAGLERAALLGQHARGLRALRQAYSDVYIEDGTRALRKLSQPACRTAVQALQTLERDAPDLMLTVEPLGPRTLTTLLAPCRG